MPNLEIFLHALSTFDTRWLIKELWFSYTDGHAIYSTEIRGSVYSVRRKLHFTPKNFYNFSGWCLFFYILKKHLPTAEMSFRINHGRDLCSHTISQSPSPSVIKIFHVCFNNHFLPRINSPGKKFSHGRDLDRGYCIALSFDISNGGWNLWKYHFDLVPISNLKVNTHRLTQKKVGK